jgi:preprotein translocase subunit SecE
MSSEGEPGELDARGTATVPGVAERERRRKPKRKEGAGNMAEHPIARGVGVGRADRRSFFEYYKRGQGVYTRGGTAVGAAVLTLAGADFVYDQLGAFESGKAWTLWVQIGVPALMIVVLGLFIWWIVGVNRRCCDFMIATEGEMKKVSWSSKRELIGSTKVVILFTILLAIVLFVVDVIFIQFFGAIKVLKAAPSLLDMFAGK